MPTRREAIKGLLSLSMSPLMPVYAMEMDYVEQFIDIHKEELIQIGLILTAVCIIIAAGIAPTKALIMYMIL